MNKRTPLLTKLVRDGMYVVDEQIVAEAILLRGTARRLVPGLQFPAEVKPQLRSSVALSTPARFVSPIRAGAPRCSS